ncbi:phosphoribosylaminoimidazolesuccinocarboxamide synthase [bacterium]|nr:phosphoribosylaminoimidazolesuccinocarboxamide synthase [candidate division CSSED10-310 bacterium]
MPRQPSLKIEGLNSIREGKVRSLFEMPDGNLLIVASDRISAFDVILPTAIPDKGKVLTQISNFWFDHLSSIPAHHIIETNFDHFPDYLQPHRSILEGRSTIVRKAQVIPFECVVRGYISGSLWSAYQKGQSVYGLNLPPNLQESSPFPEPLFTPTTKADMGHDMPVTQKQMSKEIGTDLTNRLKSVAIAIFNEGSQLAAEKGIILADTKFEFGLIDDQLILIDECLTPDSSRFWPQSEYAPGRSQPSFDKQYVRDYLTTLNWDKTYPGPELPDWVVNSTRNKYLEVYRLITGKDLFNN